jgi:DNA-binding transcriptional MocR family regulator
MLGALDEFKKLRQAQLLPRRDLLARLLKRDLPQWSFRTPRGGLFLWVELPQGDSREFAQVALRHGVILLPGPAMSDTEGHVRFLRVPFLAEPGTIQDGVRRLAAAWRDYQSDDRVAPRGTVTLV